VREKLEKAEQDFEVIGLALYVFAEL